MHTANNPHIKSSDDTKYGNTHNATPAPRHGRFTSFFPRMNNTIPTRLMTTPDKIDHGFPKFIPPLSALLPAIKRPGRQPGHTHPPTVNPFTPHAQL